MAPQLHRTTEQLDAQKLNGERTCERHPRRGPLLRVARPPLWCQQRWLRRRMMPAPHGVNGAALHPLWRPRTLQPVRGTRVLLLPLVGSAGCRDTCEPDPAQLACGRGHGVDGEHILRGRDALSQ